MDNEIEIYTIGFTKKSAETFFRFIRDSNINTVLDVRINNVSQLAGFAKRDDLQFFLKELCNAEYVYVPEFAPRKTMFNAYKKGELPWDWYAEKFLYLMVQRNIEKSIKPALLAHGCLLCSEHEPHFCHRRLVVEYFNEHSIWNLKVKYLY